MSAVLLIVGVPLDDDAAPSAEAAAAMRAADVIVGESRGRAFPLLKRAEALSPEKEVFLLDPPRADERDRLFERLTALAKTGGTVALFSDAGMPMLFDPGAEIARFCRERGFQVRSVPGPTSWGTACALSGWDPPFFVAGFPPRDNEERGRWLSQLRATPGHAVLMDTPYRYRLSLKQVKDAFGSDRDAFLAWELGRASERLLWGSLDAIERESERLGLEKGEFVLVVSSSTVMSGTRKDSSFPPSENSSTPSGRSSSWGSRSTGSGKRRHETRRKTTRR